jgi:hypothetical protein
MFIMGAASGQKETGGKKVIAPFPSSACIATGSQRLPLVHLPAP